MLHPAPIVSSSSEAPGLSIFAYRRVIQGIVADPDNSHPTRPPLAAVLRSSVPADVTKPYIMALIRDAAL